MAFKIKFSQEAMDGRGQPWSKWRHCVFIAEALGVHVLNQANLKLEALTSGHFVVANGVELPFHED